MGAGPKICIYTLFVLSVNRVLVNRRGPIACDQGSAGRISLAEKFFGKKSQNGDKGKIYPIRFLAKTQDLKFFSVDHFLKDNFHVFDF